jgi:carbamoylphosphate synthase large subunit
MILYFGQPKFSDWIECIKNMSLDNDCIVKIGNLDNLQSIKNNILLLPTTPEQAMYLYPDAMIEICSNKRKFQEFMESDENLIKWIPKRVDTTNFPFIMKATCLYGGVHVYLVKNSMEYKKNLRIFNKQKIDFIIQENIKHRVYFVGHFFVYKGTIHYEIFYRTTKKDTDYPIKHGPIKNFVKENNNDFRSIFVTIFEKLNYTGFACIDFCTNLETNDCKIFEINPRLGGSIVHDKTDFKNIVLCALDVFGRETSY